MRNLHYAGETLTVDPDICSAIFEYAKALANARLSDVIQVPVLIDGRREFSNMLLGPASMLFCTPAEQAGVDLTDRTLLADLNKRISALQPVQGTVSSAQTEAHYAYDYSDL
jgi:hypothetical protein